jgi:predicted membrane channel-forming protein YqfA (hemolysin III family)
MELLLKSLMMAIGIRLLKTLKSVIGEPLFWVILIILIGLAVIGIIAEWRERKKSK